MGQTQVLQAEGRGGMSGSPQTAGLIFGGSAPSPGQNVESWNGSLGVK